MSHISICDFVYLFNSNSLYYKLAIAMHLFVIHSNFSSCHSTMHSLKDTVCQLLSWVLSQQKKGHTLGLNWLSDI